MFKKNLKSPFVFDSLQYVQYCSSLTTYVALREEKLNYIVLFKAQVGNWPWWFGKLSGPKGLGDTLVNVLWVLCNTLVSVQGVLDSLCSVSKESWIHSVQCPRSLGFTLLSAPTSLDYPLGKIGPVAEGFQHL